MSVNSVQHSNNCGTSKADTVNVKPPPMPPSSAAHFWRSKRFFTAIVGFFGTFVIYAHRVSMSVAIVCMVNHTAVQQLDDSSANGRLGAAAAANGTRALSTAGGCHADGNENVVDTNPLEGAFKWDSRLQGLILGAFYWGYILPQIPAGILCQRYGARVVILTCGATSTVATLLTPLAATFSVYVLILMRFVAGLGGAMWFPSFHHFWSTWSPRDERSRLGGFTYAGIHFGIILTLPVASLLCKTPGWQSIFYVFGGLGAVWCIVCFFNVYDEPSSHPRISKAEERYINACLSQMLTTDKQKIYFPLRKVVRSAPFWAIIIGNVGYDWGGYAFMTNMPKFFKEVLNFKIEQNGFYSAVPYIGFWIVSVVASILADWAIRTEKLTITWTRKSMTIISFLVPGALVVVVGYMGCSYRGAAVAILTVGVATKGFIFGGQLVNHMDIAPRCAGILMGISNCFGAATGFIGPPVLGALTYRNPIEGWRVFFFITSAMYIIAAIMYGILASGELQPWARPRSDTIEIDELEKAELSANPPT